LNTLSSLREKLTRGKKYREAFVASQLKRGIPFQIRALRKQRDWSQQRLAQEADLTQGVISRAEDPDYGNLTLNTLLRIAAGFDVAFVGKFVPFSELGRWFLDQSETTVRVSSFGEDVGFERKEPESAFESLARWKPRNETRPGDVRSLYRNTPSIGFTTGPSGGLLTASAVASGAVPVPTPPSDSARRQVDLKVPDPAVSGVPDHRRTGAPDEASIAVIAGALSGISRRQQPAA